MAKQIQEDLKKFVREALCTFSQVNEPYKKFRFSDDKLLKPLAFRKKDPRFDF